MNATVHHAPALHTRLERQLNSLLVISRRWRWYESDLQTAFKAITETAASALAVERASVWVLDDDHTEITCRDLYESKPHRHSQNFKLKRADYPAYFAALESEDLIAATDAHHDPSTRAFSEGYLKPHGIGAMLDAPIRVGGKLVGVLCHEHIGGPRMFLSDEQTTATLLANLVALALELQYRKQAEEEAEEMLSLLKTAVEASGTAILALDLKGSVVYCNEELLELWGVSRELVGPAGDHGPRMAQAAARTTDPARYIERVQATLADPSLVTKDVFVLVDGRVVECSSRPQRLDGKIIGRVWAYRLS